jgi:hypothetical protein
MKRASPIAAALIVFSIGLVPGMFGGDVASPLSRWELAYHSIVPLGGEVLLLKPSNQALSFLASAESIGFEGWRQVSNENTTKLLDGDGNPVERYPRFVDFRVTVSARRKTLSGLEPLVIEWKSDIQNVNEYLLNLRFRVKIFRALHVTVLEPKAVKIVGVPFDVPYDERIFRLSFDLGDVPVDDRIILEVLSPDGERLTRFHLDM